MIERRVRRADDKPAALALFLEAHRKKLGVRGLAVATRDGRVLAGAGASPERLAHAAVEIDHARGGAAETNGHVATWRLRAGGMEVVLASHGGRLSYEVGDGIKRILA